MEESFELSTAAIDPEVPPPPPVRVSVLPETVGGILDCAAHEIGLLHQKARSSKAHVGLTEDEEDALDDGFACVDLNVLTNKLSVWRQHLFPSVTPCYAVKCNPDPLLVHWLARHNRPTLGSAAVVGFDCASLHELQMATAELAATAAATETPPQRQPKQHPQIVYANPQRSEDDLLRSLTLFGLQEDLWMTLDGPEELHKMAEACLAVGRPKSTLGLIVRILVPDGSSKVPLGEKFGLDASAVGDFDDPSTLTGLVVLANTLGFGVIGVSFHCGSGCHDPPTYRAALGLAEHALEIIDQTQAIDQAAAHLPCWVLDIGGGFPGQDGAGGDIGRFSGRPRAQAAASRETNQENTQKEETAAAIAEAIRTTLDRLRDEKGLVLLAEPGRYFVEESSCLVSRIYDAWWEMEDLDDNDDKNDDNDNLNGTNDDLRRGHHRRVYQIAHGVHGVFKDVLLCQERFVPKPLPHANCVGSDHTTTAAQKEKDTVLSVVKGPSGDTRDIVSAGCLLPVLEIGDWLVFDRMGAYTLSIASRTGRPVVRFVKGGGCQKGGNPWDPVL